MSSLAGSPTENGQQGELSFWQHYPEAWIDNLAHYRPVFPFESIDYSREILDVGSGPKTVFEEIAPAHARIIPADTLADEFNRLMPDKRFPVVATIPARKFRLITLFNMIDHMERPEELLAQLVEHLAEDGELWLYVHLDRPYDPVEHPQCYRFWQVAPLMQKFFTIKSCGIENRIPSINGFWCVCTQKGKSREVRSLRWSRTLGGIYASNVIRRYAQGLHRRIRSTSR